MSSGRRLAKVESRNPTSMAPASPIPLPQVDWQVRWAGASEFAPLLLLLKQACTFPSSHRILSLQGRRYLFCISFDALAWNPSYPVSPPPAFPAALASILHTPRVNSSCSPQNRVTIYWRNCVESIDGTEAILSVPRYGDSQ